MCGGRYHGKGLAYAREQLVEDLRAGVFGEEVRVLVEELVEQRQLF